MNRVFFPGPPRAPAKPPRPSPAGLGTVPSRRPARTACRARRHTRRRSEPAAGVWLRPDGRAAESLAARGAWRRRSGKAEVEPEVPEPEIEHAAAYQVHYPGQQDEGK